MTFITRKPHAKKVEIAVLIQGIAHTWRSVLPGFVPLLMALSFILSGCGGDGSPSSPTATRSIEEGKTAEELPTAVLHAILLVDTNASGSIGEALTRDLRSMTTLTDNIAAYAGMSLNRQILSGAGATKSALEQALDGISAGPDDAIFFYFSGHGGRTAATATHWPDMYLNNIPALNLNEVFNRLHSKGPRLLLALGDTCNGPLDEHIGTPFSLAALRDRPEGYRKLFAETQGAIIASSSVVGELSYSQADGSLFTKQFLRALSSEINANMSDWRDLMQSATRLIQVADIEQHPQYLIY